MQNGNGKSNIIVLSDILVQKLRMERVLIFYEAQLAHLVVKMQLVKKEIQITNIIIDLVNQEKIIDIQEYLDKMEH